jgi:hypothetical protein
MTKTDKLINYVRIAQPCTLDDIARGLSSTFTKAEIKSTVWQLVEEGTLNFNDKWLVVIR